MQRSHTAPLLVFWKVLFQRWLRASWLLMGKCEHSDNKGDKWTVERMGPEDAWVSRGGGGNPGGEGPTGGAGSGLGHLGGTPRTLWGFKPRSDTAGRALLGQTGLVAMLGAGGEGRAEGETEGAASAARPGPAEAAVGTLRGRSFLAHQAGRGGEAPAGPALTEKSRGGRFTFLTSGDKRSYKNCRQVCLTSW